MCLKIEILTSLRFRSYDLGSPWTYTNKLNLLKLSICLQVHEIDVLNFTLSWLFENGLPVKIQSHIAKSIVFQGIVQ